MTSRVFSPKNLLQVVPDAFGLSISSRNVKFAYLKKHHYGFKLEAFGEHDFSGRELVVQGSVTAPQELALEITKGLGGKIGTLLPPYAVLSLPEEDVFLRAVQMPRMSASELSEAIRWETEANIPVSIDEVYFDYNVVPPLNPGAKQEHLDVLVVAILKNVVDGYTKAVENAGISPIVLEPESMSLARSLIAGQYAPHPVVLLDIGFTRTRFVIVSGDNVRFTSFIPVSIEPLIAEIQKKLSVSFDEAEQMLFKKGLQVKDSEPDLRQILGAYLEDLAAQVKKFITFYNGHSEHEHDHGSHIARAYLAGGGALIPALDSYLTSKLMLPVTLGNPWTNIFPQPLHQTPPISYRDSVRFAPVLGLALRGANLDLALTL